MKRLFPRKTEGFIANNTCLMGVCSKSIFHSENVSFVEFSCTHGSGLIRLCGLDEYTFDHVHIGYLHFYNNNNCKSPATSFVFMVIKSLFTVQVS